MKAGQKYTIIVPEETIDGMLQVWEADGLDVQDRGFYFFVKDTEGELEVIAYSADSKVMRQQIIVISDELIEAPGFRNEILERLLKEAR